MSLILRHCESPQATWQSMKLHIAFWTATPDCAGSRRRTLRVNVIASHHKSDRSGQTPMNFEIQQLRDAISAGRIHWHAHALARFLERGISRQEILTAVMLGELIDTYPSDRPFPSGLIFYRGISPVHVVSAVEPTASIAHIITAYRPDLDHFESDLKTRRVKS